MATPISRRSALAALAGGGVVLGGACAAGGDKTAAPATTTVPAGVELSAAAAEHRYLDFYGDHQAGIAAVGQSVGLMASFDLIAGGRDEVVDTFKALSSESARLMSGEPYPDRDPAYPSLYTGHVGNPPPPADLSIVVSVGASLFRPEWGLADRKPAELIEMPFLTNDRLDPTRSHGDVLLSIASASQDVNLFALRQLMRSTRDTLTLHWMIEGSNRRVQAEEGEAGVRNLMGFVDGTANPDPTDDRLMGELVWIAEGDGEPAWATFGTYQVVRVIRMFVEFWDRTRLSEQEAIIGRQKQTGAPIGGERELDIPDFVSDPEGEVTPLDAHIRLANPRDEDTKGQRILRKGFNFSRGFDGSGQLDQGLAFVSFQRSIENQFLPIQERLDGEPLEEYILPVGGGYFFVLPGVPDADHYLGEPLLA